MREALLKRQDFLNGPQAGYDIEVCGTSLNNIADGLSNAVQSVLGVKSEGIIGSLYRLLGMLRQRTKGQNLPQ
jgi:hypothetical protein